MNKFDTLKENLSEHESISEYGKQEFEEKETLKYLGQNYWIETKGTAKRMKKKEGNNIFTSTKDYHNFFIKDGILYGKMMENKEPEAVEFV